MLNLFQDLEFIEVQMNNCKIQQIPMFEGVKKLKILILEANNNQIENIG